MIVKATDQATVLLACRVRKKIITNDELVKVVKLLVNKPLPVVRW